MVTKASIEVHDLKGITVKSFNLDIKGFASLNLDGSQLPAGTYIYYLVVDDELVDSKVMIIN
jgi:hypothetical protein